MENKKSIFFLQLTYFLFSFFVFHSSSHHNHVDISIFLSLLCCTRINYLKREKLAFQVLDFLS